MSSYQHHVATAILVVPLAAAFLLPGLTQSSDKTSSLPTSEEFTNLVRNCAAGADIELSAALVGSIKTLYEGQKTDGYAKFKTSTTFLQLMPVEPRLEAYKLYVTCIKDIVHGK